MPFGLTPSMIKIGAIIAAVIAFIAVLGWGKYEHVQAQRWKAEYERAADANEGLAEQVKAITADKAAADARAAAAEKAFRSAQAKRSADAISRQKEVDRAATKADEVCSRALAAAFGRVCE